MTAHLSEHQVGRIKWCDRCARNHLFPRWQAGPRTLPAPDPWWPTVLVLLIAFGGPVAIAGVLFYVALVIPGGVR
jgi:hypothetical protein